MEGQMGTLHWMELLLTQEVPDVGSPAGSTSLDWSNSSLSGCWLRGSERLYHIRRGKNKDKRCEVKELPC